MKQIVLFISMVLFVCPFVYGQDIINNPVSAGNSEIHQIRSSGYNSILGFQTLNRESGNIAMSQQVGDYNRSSIRQQLEAGLSNQAYTVQQGNSNEMSLVQIGSGNTFLSFQLGYIANAQFRNQQVGQSVAGVGVSTVNVSGTSTLQNGNSFLVIGERNKLTINQNGNNNGVLAVQQGNDNVLSASQKGNENYLLVMQKGSNNKVVDYKQENSNGKPSYDAIVQIGENLMITAEEASKSKDHGNNFSQTGINLALKVDNSFLNSLGGVEITQTGRDMSVVVNQSYFSFPMK